MEGRCSELSSRGSGQAGSECIGVEPLCWNSETVARVHYDLTVPTRGLYVSYKDQLEDEPKREE